MGQRLYLTFEKSSEQSPILSSLTARFGVMFNIFGATVNEESQLFVVELLGEQPDIDRALGFLRDSGVRVEASEDRMDD